MAKKILLFCCCLSVLWSYPCFAQNTTGQKQNNEETEKNNLVTCTSEQYNIKFLCNLKWTLKFIDDDTTMFTISKSPYVTLTISHIDEDISFLAQVTKSFLEKKNIYAENFQRARFPFAGGESIKVKAFSKIEPDMRFVSYFFLNDKGLNNVLFSVYPKSKWDDYKFLIKEITESFEPLERKE